VTPTPRPGGDDLLTALQQLVRLMGSRQASARLAAAAGVDVSQQAVQILRALDRDGRQPIAALATRAQMDVAAVSRQRRLLERRGLVTTSADPHDARVVLVGATPAGARAARRLRAAGARHVADALRDWSDDDRDRLACLLTRLVRDLRVTDVVRLGTGPAG
jgi:DNA-binding MarR family transcriptional regulator